MDKKLDCIHVSILILLDASLLVSSWRVLRIRDLLSFNPYFTGCFSFRQYEWNKNMTVISSFNPYFTGCFSFSRHNVLHRDIQACFNPYFTGCFSFRHRQPKRLGSNWCFNPYVTGCFSFSLTRSNRSMWNQSFNPYFTGCFSFSWLLDDSLIRQPPVSILILLDASLLVPMLSWYQIGIDRFQSLFYWMLLF